MTLARTLRVWTAPIVQRRRSHDGIRGIMAKRRFYRGDLLMSVPIVSCYFPHASSEARLLRRWNRATLFPEMPVWLPRLSPDAEEGRVSLIASVSTEDNKVLTLALSPVEAALAISVALRYFWRDIIRLNSKEEKNKSSSIGPLNFRPADLYVQSLPMKEHLSFGLEGPYMSAVEDEANLHSCIEQIAWNLRDCLLSYASQEEYRVYDSHPSELDAVLLAAVYVVRTRLIHMRVLHEDSSVPDRSTSVIAPIVDFLNHSSFDYSCAACVSMRKRAVVVRAARDINIGEELTLNYRGTRKQLEESYLGGDDNWWESRYLISAEDA
ncbi:SET domain [Trypanosoma melophagium]|uniref:SET domain n=1 Tax=Trypanosoma melophagium TaxID=715481 RepID=UPI00351AAE45|nr:SET domain [Trypanosoma melophagium]